MINPSGDGTHAVGAVAEEDVVVRLMLGMLMAMMVMMMMRR